MNRRRFLQSSALAGPWVAAAWAWPAKPAPQTGTPRWSAAQITARLGISAAVYQRMRYLMLMPFPLLNRPTDNQYEPSQGRAGRQACSGPRRTVTPPATISHITRPGTQKKRMNGATANLRGDTANVYREPGLPEETRPTRSHAPPALMPAKLFLVGPLASR